MWLNNDVAANASVLPGSNELSPGNSTPEPPAAVNTPIINIDDQCSDGVESTPKIAEEVRQWWLAVIDILVVFRSVLLILGHFIEDIF